VWLSFLVCSFCHAPVPAVNEPHWLTKSKHYWQPAWCSQDFFLESADTHLVFYQTIGALTAVLSFDSAAVAGRLIGYLLLACGWTTLCRWASGLHETAVPAAWICMLLAAAGNLSGEWMVGGIEAKVVSYAFVFLGLPRLMEAQWVRAGFLLGLGTAVHPLVGIWSLIAAGLAVLLSLTGEEQRRRLQRLDGLRSPRCLLGAAVLILVSLAGIVPALQAVSGATRQETWLGNYLQVFHRLDHHLDPMQFDAWRYAMYGLLAVVAWWLIRSGERRPQILWLGRIVLASGLIAGMGWLAGLRDPAIPDIRLAEKMPLYDLRVLFLKFYPFRLVDILLPVLVAILLARHAVSRLDHFYPRLIHVALATVIVTSLWLSAGQGSVHRMSEQQQADWLEACRWIRSNTEENALVHTPRQSWAFKWFAGRPEYVALKDCPQDAQGIVEWNSRLNGIRDWAEANYHDRLYSQQETDQLHARTGITYLLVRRLGPFEVQPLFRNETYQVYRIAPRH